MDRVLTAPRNAILGLLLAFAGAAWALLLIWHGSDSKMDMSMASPTMGLRAPLFLAIWVTMVAAMMFPTAAPMVLTFHRVQAGRRQRGGTFVPTWVFVAGYMVVWTLAGVAAYAAVLVAEAGAEIAALSSQGRWGRPRRCGHLSAYAAEGSVPVEVPHAARLPHDVLA
jgi:predicted metal-binding membrane protein